MLRSPATRTSPNCGPTPRSLAPHLQPQAFQSVTVAADGGDGFKRLKAALAADPRLKLDVLTTRDYYAKQSEGLTKLINILGTVIGTIMAIGAVFGALNTMYAAVAGRAREIATMRAHRFPRPAGGDGGDARDHAAGPARRPARRAARLAACSTATRCRTLGQNFSQVVFQFRVSPELLWTGLKWALGIGLVGGLFPALRAARLPVTEALRGG